MLPMMRRIEYNSSPLEKSREALFSDSAIAPPAKDVTFAGCLLPNLSRLVIVNTP
jgi:hypothetical protein